MSKITRVTKETVSLDQLKQHLPQSAYEAVLSSMKTDKLSTLDDSLYHEYFNATPTPVLSESEQTELFEQLGNGWVKNHYSTDTLRSFLNSEPSVKKSRFKNE